ncbi:hypothetical protein ABH909_004922 [Pseudomonas sp. BS3782 TE3695]|uniref:type II toxin-antitoxin system PrlF family antitoxin n=1 Tax=Pseudomonas sp. BS3782 TE3695 TaxID=3349323 RepID=UPI003D19022F
MNDSNPTPPISRIHSGSEPERSDASNNDREICEFLTLLEDDIRSHPEKLVALDSTLLARLNSLIGGIDVDINARLSADDE